MVGCTIRLEGRHKAGKSCVLDDQGASDGGRGDGVDNNVTISATDSSEGATPNSSRWAVSQSGRWFYIGMAVSCLLVSIAAFAPSIVDQRHRLGSSTWLVVAHGSLFFLWLVVFVAQTLLVRRGAYRVHRRLGLASLGLASAMVVVGYIATIAMTRRGFDFSGDLDLAHDPLGPVGQLIFPLLDIWEFALLVALGFAFRRRPDYHKRLMLFATIALLPAPFAHFIGHIPALKAHAAIVVLAIFVSLAASAIYDLAAFRRVHPISLWVGLGMFILDNLSATVIGHSTLWLRIAHRLVE